LNNVGTRDVGRHEVRRELDPLELQIHDLGDAVNQQCLGQAGHADDQAVPADEKREQHLIDDFVLPDDQLAQLPDHLFAAVLQPISEGDIICVVQLYGSDRVVSQSVLPSGNRAGPEFVFCG